MAESSGSGSTMYARMGGELGAVAGDFEDVVLGLSDEVGDVIGMVGDVSGFVESDGGVESEFCPRRARRVAKGFSIWWWFHPRRFGFARDRLFGLHFVLRRSGSLGRSECVVQLLFEVGHGSIGLAEPVGTGAVRCVGAVLAAVGGRLRLGFGDFAEASVVEDAGGPDAVVSVGGGVVTLGDIEEVVEDALNSAGGVLNLEGGVSGEGGVDGCCLCIWRHEHQFRAGGLGVSSPSFVHEGHEGSRRVFRFGGGFTLTPTLSLGERG